MILLGLDFETTGLDTKTCEVIEVGAVLWDSDEKKPLALMSDLIFGPIVPPEITAITGIREDDLRFGRLFDEVRDSLLDFAVRADFIVAHNGNAFDRPIYERVFNPLSEKNWLDTMTDVPYPKHITTRKLPHLAADHGFLNPFAHRAVFDVLSMLRLLSFYDLEAVIKSAALPPIKIQALVSYTEREKAKTRGYRWNGEEAMWWRIVKQPELEIEMREAGFPVRIVS